MTSAALLGVDTCPMEGLDPAGYRAAEDQYSIFPKVRFDKKDIITYLP